MKEDTNLLEQQKETQKPDGLPDKFWDKEKGEVRVDALVKSYTELEKRLSNAIPEPTDDETRARFLRAAGVPASAEEYNIKVRDDLFEPDMELNTRLHAKGFNAEQV